LRKQAGETVIPLKISRSLKFVLAEAEALLGAFRQIVVVTVRREKALDFSGCNSRPGTGSFHPVAIEAAAEATKLSELSM
jgi:hypothetical protein